MGFSEIYRSVARRFSVKDIKIANRKSCKSPKKLTKSQKPTNNTKTTKTKVKNFVGFLTSSRSKRYSTGNQAIILIRPNYEVLFKRLNTNIELPESETLVGSSGPSSAGDITVETFLQVPEQAGSNDAVSSNGVDGFTGPSFADTVLPILTAITTGANETIVHDFAPPSPLATSSVEPVVENNSENGSDRLDEVAQLADHAASIHSNNDIDFVDDTIALPPASSTPSVKVIFDKDFGNGSEHAASVHNNEAIDTEGGSLTLCASFEKLSADIESSYTDHTIYASVTQWTEHLTFETLVSSELVVDVTEPIGITVPLPASISQSPAGNPEEVEISIQLSETNKGNSVDPIVQDDSSSSSRKNVADVGEQSDPFPEYIDGYHFDDTTGPFAAATTVPFVARSKPGSIIKAPWVQPLIADEDVESFYRQVYVRRDSAPGRLVSPDSYYPVGRRASLSQSDADIEPMLNRSENYLEINDSDVKHYVLPHPDEFELDEEPTAFPELTIMVADVTLAIPERRVAHSDPAPEVIHTDHNQVSEDVATELVPENQSDLMEKELFISGLAEQGIFISDLSEQGIFPVAMNTPKLIEQKPEQIQGLEEIVEEIIRTQVIPHHHQFTSRFLPPGIVIPWGPNNPVPIRLADFRATDPWLPSPFNDPFGYDRLSEVQKRWRQLEVAYQQTIYWICMNFTASNHLENNPGNTLYCFNNICGYFGCQEKDCKHPRVRWGGLHWSYEKWKQHRLNQLKLGQRRANQQAASQQQYGRPPANVQASQGQPSKQDAFAQRAIAELTTRQRAAAQSAAQKAPRKRPAKLQLLVQQDSNYEPPTGLNSAVQALEQDFHEKQAHEQKAREQEALEAYTVAVEKGVGFSAAQIKQSLAQEAQKMAAFQEANAQPVTQEAGPSIDDADSGPSQLINPQSSKMPFVTDLTRSTDPKDDMISGGLEAFGDYTEDSRPDHQLVNDAFPHAPANPAQKAHLGPEGIVVGPKISRWKTMFPPKKEGTTSEEGTLGDPAPYSDESNRQTSVSDGSEKATKSTADTSLEGSLKVPQLVVVSKQEANDQSVIYTPNEVEEGDLYSSSPLKARYPAFATLANPSTLEDVEEDDLYSASPRRLPNPASAAPINSFPPPAPEELVEDSVASSEEGASKMYDDQGFVVENAVKDLNGSVIEDLTRSPDYRSSDDGETQDEESEDEDSRGDTESDNKESEDGETQDEESEDEDSTDVIDENGWLVAERRDHPMIQKFNDAFLDGDKAVIEQVDDMTNYINAIDTSNAVDVGNTELGNAVAPRNAADLEVGPINSGLEEDEDLTGDDEFPLETKPVCRELLPQAGTVRFGQRIAISSRPATSGLAGAFRRQEEEEARGIFRGAPLGPEDHRDVLLDQEFLPILQRDAREIHLSNMFRKMDRAKNHIANQWMNNVAQQNPGAPNVDYVAMPRAYGYADENIVLPRDVVEEMNEADQEIWAMGMAYTEHDRLDEMDDPAKFTSEMETVQPALINKSWKPELIEEYAEKFNVTHCVLLPGDNDPSAFDDEAATF
ncbi:hypothetical protein OCU04_010442 [Sclerotinia nivalis]|uniref:Uncharacterized protein n=1 Tax=Sclerotinia nivalis TaxID=352851 RepID=A0A9X0AEJ7_9HELO|nr:hypothetical protein OCU04_010442 [Sclerotinia nivalis]